MWAVDVRNGGLGFVAVRIYTNQRFKYKTKMCSTVVWFYTRRVHTLPHTHAATLPAHTPPPTTTLGGLLTCHTALHSGVDYLPCIPAFWVWDCLPMPACSMPLFCCQILLGLYQVPICLCVQVILHFYLLFIVLTQALSPCAVHCLRDGGGVGFMNYI